MSLNELALASQGLACVEFSDGVRRNHGRAWPGEQAQAPRHRVFARDLDANSGPEAKAPDDSSCVRACARVCAWPCGLEQGVSRR